MSDSETKIIVTVTPEPEGLHGTKDVFAVHLSFDGSKEMVEKLLKQDWSFTLYKDKASVDPKPVPLPLQSHPEISADRLTSWLNDERNAFDEALAKGKTNSEMYVQSVGARELLMAAAGWDAPIPQMAGLTLLYERKGFEDEILVPDGDNGTQPVFVDSTEDDSGYTDVDLCDIQLNGQDVRVLTHKLYKAADEKQLGIKDGFLNKIGSEADFSILKKFQGKAASLFWSLPAWLDFNSKVLGEMDAEKYHGALLGYERKNEVPADISALIDDNLGKLEHAGLSLALDQVWIALFQPTPPNVTDTSEGALLAPLIGFLEEEAQDSSNTYLSEQLEQLRTNLGEVRDGLDWPSAVSYTHLRAHETLRYLV